MRYKNEIWEYFNKYSLEEQILTYKRELIDDAKPFSYMEEERFHRLLNTYRWLTKFILVSINIEGPMSKPFDADILEALSVIRTESERLLAFGKKYEDVLQIRRDLIKKAKKRLACVDYYTKLVDEGFFKDKEIRR